MCQNLGPEGWEMNIVALLFGAHLILPIPIASPKAPQILLPSSKSTQKCLEFKFRACNQGRIDSLLLKQS
ncbi:hypothetical protein [Vibrio gazogenes]|uniref:Uncharacterized protein n=1 Tax=Vibrio gazogenes TaxID=687 RepID=A0A1Z2SDT8_VIBGA|nr:hypothetical protein [Vibrio gazogenes]ASA55308.1 hypothetical protein BSQ33_05935 [Vibrio gazogenes]